MKKNARATETNRWLDGVALFAYALVATGGIWAISSVATLVSLPMTESMIESLRLATSMTIAGLLGAALADWLREERRSGSTQSAGIPSIDIHSHFQRGHRNVPKI